MGGKIVNSNCPEFGYELLSAVPYAYNLYLKGELEETVSGFDTSCLYFFSPKHTETNCQRSWDNMKKLWDNNFPNIKIHRPQLDWELFASPPFKEYYSDKKIEFEKETLVIFNRYNKEWDGPPINYLDLDTLDVLFNMLSDKYQVIYINLNKGDKYFDGVKPLDLNDDVILKKYPNVYSLYDVMDMHPNVSINEIQLRIFANCSKYISSNGGQLILSAYFGGENIIFSKKCREINNKVNSFYKWYHKLGGGIFQHVSDYQSLIELVKEKWIDDKPLINILIRTSSRPQYFNGCMESIYNQKYKNWNVIVGIDDPKSFEYTQPHKCIEVEYNYSHIKIPNPPNNTDYGVPFKYNLYLNELQKKVKNGFVIILDDDDAFHDMHSLTKLVNVIKTEDDFVMWRVKFPDRLVPSNTNFGKIPVVKDIDSDGFTFHHKYNQEWEPYKRGDYRIAKKLYQTIPNKIYLNEILTKTQRESEGGRGRKDDMGSKHLSIIIPTYNTPNYLNECLISVIQSCGNINCEVLVGIDRCENTLNYIKSKDFDPRIRFFYFENNVGPYVIKNSLSKISRSDSILFFDSDDIMKDTMVSDIINKQNNFEFVKPMYSNFNNIISNIKVNEVKTGQYGEGVFSIKKDLFLHMNGFEGWRCAADSDFMKRLYKNNRKFSYTDEVLFYRRKHSSNLTTAPETGFMSKLRAGYASITKNKKDFGPLPNIITENFTEIYPNNYTLIGDYGTSFINDTIDREKSEVISRLTLKRQTLKPIIQEVKESVPEKKEYITVDNTGVINTIFTRKSNPVVSQQPIQVQNNNRQPVRNSQVQKDIINEKRKLLSQSQQKVTPDGFKQKKTYNKGDMTRRGGSFNF